MHSAFDMDALLRNSAKTENVALPFAQWKVEIMEKAQLQSAQIGANQDALPLQMDAVQEGGNERRRLYKRLSYGIATAAAALLIVLGANSLQEKDMAMPAPIGSYESGRALTGDTMQEEAQQAPAAMPEAAMLAPEGAENQIEAPDEIEAPFAAQEWANAEDSAYPELKAAPFMAAGIGDEREANAIAAVLEYIGDMPSAGAGQADAGIAPLAEYVENTLFTIYDIKGKAKKAQPEEGFLVSVGDADYVRTFLVDANTSEVLGELH